MKRLERRAVLCLILSAAMLAGMVLFVFRFTVRGGNWASSAFNRHLYNSAGQLKKGTVLDRNGEVLSTVNESGERVYTDGKNRRRAILHVVGDPAGNIGTGALTAFAWQLTGYNLITGASGSGAGNDLYLTIDAEVNEVAYQALNGHKGTVAVYNYKTGEVLCMVSAPSFDPRSIPEDLETNPKYEGAYLNRCLTATFTPGSVFKTVTLSAALEHLPDLEERTWTCTGETVLSDGTVTCTEAHGEQNIWDAYANSCNMVFGLLAVELGGDTLQCYADRAGLTRSGRVDGIPTAPGSFDWDREMRESDLAWAGVGQYHDAVNPCALMVYMGAIANGGRAAVPRLVQRVEKASGLPALPRLTARTGRMMPVFTAEKLADMMAYNVSAAYGKDRFPDVEICAKTGTAEVGDGQEPHAWFAGFLRSQEHPYAFVVLVENGGSGNRVAGNVAAKVLRALVED